MAPSQADREPPPVPRSLQQTYESWHWQTAWSFVPGTVVFRLAGEAGEVRFLKLSGGPRTPRLALEVERLRWAREYLPVPSVIDSGREDGVDWLVTSGLPGQPGVSPELLAAPDVLVATLARGLRRFHDAAPVASCPFDFRLDAAPALVRSRAEAELIEAEADFNLEHAHLKVEEALARLESRRPLREDLVVCHGDYCFPNALIQANEVTGYVDLGALGVADRWWDLAVASWSTVWNVGPGYEELFFRSYGVDADEEKMAYYRLLYDVSPEAWCPFEVVSHQPRYRHTSQTNGPWRSGQPSH